MRRVAIIGVGVTPRTKEYTKDNDRKSWKEYVVEAVYNAIADVDKGMNPKEIQYVLANYHGEATVEAGGIGPVVSDILGLHPAGVTVLCANCTGAGVSTHEAFGLVASGRYDMVLVVGFDKQRDMLNAADRRPMCTDVDFDFNQANVVQPGTISINNTSTTASIYVTSTYGADPFGGGNLKYVFDEQLTGSGFVAAFNFSSESTDPPFSLDSIVIQYGQYGRR